METTSDPGKLAMENASKPKSALDDLLWNCANTLLGHVRILESEKAHLAYDVEAVTIDPVTGELAEIGIGWVKTGDGERAHSFRIGSAECPAYEDEEVEDLLTAVHEDAQGHYLHAFNHLHQIAHAADSYAQEQTLIVFAEAGIADSPLLSEQRHSAAHIVHSSLAATLTACTLDMSGEPG